MLIPTNPKMLFAVALAAFLCVPAAFADESAPAAKTPPPPHYLYAATEAEKAATPTCVSRVVVFPKGARVTRSAEVSLRAGEQEILLSDIPKKLPPAFLTAETRIPGARVLAVSVVEERADYADPEIYRAAKEKVRRAKARVADLKRRFVDTVERLDSLKRSAKNLFTSARKPDAPREADTPAALRATELVAQEIRDARVTLGELHDAIRDAELDVEIAESENAKISAYRIVGRPRLVRVKLVADADCAGTIDLNYHMFDAQWRPSYDVVVDPATNAATLVSYGVVSQSTGEDWDGVPVTLSTVNPDASADLPTFKKILITETFAPRPQPIVLSKSAASAAGSGFGGSIGGSVRNGVGTGKRSGSETLSYETALRQSGVKIFSREATPQVVVSNVAAGNAVALNSGRVVTNAQDIRLAGGGYVFRNADGVLERVAAKDVAGISQNYVETQAENESVPAARLRDPAADLRGLEIRRDLARAETIPSAGTPHRCLLGSETYAGDAYLQLAPAADGNAYRMLAMTHRDFRPILAGPANIFYGADFIGEMDVPYTLRDGSVRIPLGVDPRVAVERRVVNAIETVGTFSKSRRKAVEVSVKIRNRTPEKIRVVCDEAVPVSTRDDIEVSAPEFSPAAAKFDAKTGLATRGLALEPAQEIELKTRYEIDFPENFELRERSR